VPRDVSVVGFDDIDVAEHLIPPLTTVRVDKEAMGATAVERLVSRALSARLGHVHGRSCTSSSCPAARWRLRARLARIRALPYRRNLIPPE